MCYMRKCYSWSKVTLRMSVSQAHCYGNGKQSRTEAFVLALFPLLCSLICSSSCQTLALKSLTKSKALWGWVVVSNAIRLNWQSMTVVVCCRSMREREMKTERDMDRAKLSCRMETLTKEIMNTARDVDRSFYKSNSLNSFTKKTPLLILLSCL